MITSEELGALIREYKPKKHLKKKDRVLIKKIISLLQGFNGMVALCCIHKAKHGENIPIPIAQLDIHHIDKNCNNNNLGNLLAAHHSCNASHEYNNENDAVGQSYPKPYTYPPKCDHKQLQSSNQKWSSVDVSESIGHSERQETLRDRTPTQLISDTARPRYWLWVLLLLELGYELTRELLIDILSAELMINLETIRKNYFRTITAPFAGLLMKNEADKLSGYKINPNVVILDEYPEFAHFKALIAQWIEAGKDEQRFLQIVDMSHVEQLAIIFRMPQKVLLRKIITRLTGAPLV